MLWFNVSKKILKRLGSNNIKWKLYKYLPSIFFFPLMKTDEYLIFTKTTKMKKVILEYGSGGSTIEFLKKHKKIYSVESNPDFCKYLLSVNIVKKAIGKSLFLKFIDIGNTDKWGRPVSIERKEHWHEYYSEIWKDVIQNENKVDVIFIDGRFRVCCCAYSIVQLLEHNWKETIFIIHDFWNREEYKILLTFLDEIESISTLGVFKCKAHIDVDKVKALLDAPLDYN